MYTIINRYPSYIRQLLNGKHKTSQNERLTGSDSETNEFNILTHCLSDVNQMPKLNKLVNYRDLGTEKRKNET